MEADGMILEVCETLVSFFSDHPFVLIGAQFVFLVALLALLVYTRSQNGEKDQSNDKKSKQASGGKRWAASGSSGSHKIARGLVILLTLILSVTLWSAGAQHRRASIDTRETSAYLQKHHHQQPGSLPNLFNATIAQLQAGLEAGQYTSLHLVEAYLARIHEVNSVLHAVIETAPVELLHAEAKMYDEERSLRGKRGYLHGIPILIKDNVATDVSSGMNTTAGSFALLNSVPPGDAPLIAKLKKAGAIILGKSNMSVWAQARGNTTQGWSPRGGYTSSAFKLHGNPCSSSSGAGVATSVGLAAASIGTETDGSIICPSTRNGVVGLKPTVGLASRFGVIPISSSQDTAGPIVKSVNDAAIILTSMMTPNDEYQAALDTAVRSQPRRVARGINYAKRLFDLRMEEEEMPLKGVRIGVVTGLMVNATLNRFDDQVVDIFYEGLEQLKLAGAILVNVSMPVTTDVEHLLNSFQARNNIIFAELQETIDRYLSFLKQIPSGVFNVGALLDFAYKHPDLELPQGEEDQSDIIDSLYRPVYGPIEIDKVTGKFTRKYNATYLSGQEVIRGVAEEINTAMKISKVSALVAPSDAYLYSLAAKIGAPSITVPSSFLRLEGVLATAGNRPQWPFNGAPTGICFVTPKWQEETLLKVARGFEIMQIRAGRGGYDGKVRTFKEATPMTQLQNVLLKNLPNSLTDSPLRPQK